MTFFSDDNPPAEIDRFNRVFLGSAVYYNGARDQSVVDTRGWVGKEEAAGYFTYGLSRATSVNISSIGGVSHFAATRTSDGPVGMSNVTISYAALAKSDVVSADPNGRRGAWGFYGVACRAADDGMGGIAGSAMNEFHAANFGSVVDVNPYLSRDSKSGVTYGLILGVGGEYAQSGQETNQVSAALHISGGKGAKAKFRKGIHFACNSLDGTDGYTGGTADALFFGRFHQLVWGWSGSNVARGFTIRSDCNSLAGATKLVSTNAGLQVYDQSEKTVARFTPTQLAAEDQGNFLVFKNAKMGDDPVIQAAGVEEKCSVCIQGKGDGGLVVKDGWGDILLNLESPRPVLAGDLPADGSATKAQVAFAYNSMRTALIKLGLAR